MGRKRQKKEKGKIQVDPRSQLSQSSRICKTKAPKLVGSVGAYLARLAMCESAFFEVYAHFGTAFASALNQALALL